MSILIALLFAFSASAAAQDVQSPVIVTTGEASISRPPDVAFITVSVETHARLSRDAQRQNAEMMTGVLRRLADLGVAQSDLKTVGPRVDQEYDFANGRRTLKGFVARNGVEARITDITKAGDIADGVVQAGATSVEGIRFDLKDRASVEREGLRLAVADARSRADAIAAGAGRSVDRILRIEETRTQVRFPGPMMRGMAAVSAADATPTPVEPGLIEVTARVTMTVSMKP